MFKDGSKDQKSKVISLKNPVKSPLGFLAKISPSSTAIGSKDVLGNSSGSLQLTQKQKFENFLTYKKRLSRLAIMQGLHYYEVFLKFKENQFSLDEEVNEIYRTIVYFYKRMLFSGKYGENKKNKKLDEKFVRMSIMNAICYKGEIDAYIKKHLKKSFTLYRLNSTVRAGLRAAIYEVLYSKKPNYKIIVSEYTGLVANSISQEKEVAFFNAILDKIAKEKQNEK